LLYASWYERARVPKPEKPLTVLSVGVAVRICLPRTS
jgi:hypothetical protein